MGVSFTPRLGLLLTLLVFTAGAAVGYVMLNNQPSADTSNAACRNGAWGPTANGPDCAIPAKPADSGSHLQYPASAVITDVAANPVITNAGQLMTITFTVTLPDASSNIFTDSWSYRAGSVSLSPKAGYLFSSPRVMAMTPLNPSWTVSETGIVDANGQAVYAKNLFWDDSVAKNGGPFMAVLKFSDSLPTWFQAEVSLRRYRDWAARPGYPASTEDKGPESRATAFFIKYVDPDYTASPSISLTQTEAEPVGDLPHAEMILTKVTALVTTPKGRRLAGSSVTWNLESNGPPIPSTSDYLAKQPVYGTSAEQLTATLDETATPITTTTDSDGLTSIWVAWVPDGYGDLTPVARAKTYGQSSTQVMATVTLAGEPTVPDGQLQVEYTSQPANSLPDSVDGQATDE